MNRRSDANTVSFKGNLEVNDTCITEYDKETIITALKEQVGFYRLHSLLSMPDTIGKMHSLVEDAHLFILLNVRDEYDARLVRQNPVFELDSSGVETMKESRSSIRARTKAYDEYERYDIALSRLIVESIISPSYREYYKNSILSSR